MGAQPSLEWRSKDGISFLTDPGARDRGVRIAFTDRLGGSSAAPFDSLNLSTSVGDDEGVVLLNRSAAMSAAGFSSDRPALARQIHGTRVLEAEGNSGAVIGEGDALLARRHNVVVGVLTADCVPVILAGDEGVAAVHAGWRGLADGVIEEAVEALAQVRHAWVGPGIRACCYEVGEEVEERFAERDLVVGEPGRVDPVGSAAAILARADVPAAVASECTSCDPRFYSYRRDGVTGRQGGFVEWT